MSKYPDAESYDAVLILADEERLQATEDETRALRREVDALWQLVYTLYEGRIKPSEN